MRSVDLRAVIRSFSGFVESSMSTLVEQTHALIFIASKAAELPHQTSLLQSKLSRRWVKIECAALQTGERMCTCLEDGTLYPIEVENAGECQSSWTCSDDGDTWRCGHGKALFQ